MQRDGALSLKSGNGRQEMLRNYEQTMEQATELSVYKSHSLSVLKGCMREHGAWWSDGVLEQASDLGPLGKCVRYQIANCCES